MASERVSVPQGLFDRTALRVNQGFIIGLLTVAFLANLPWLALLVALVMAVGTIAPRAALFQRLYLDILRPRGLLRPDLHAEDAAPHRFAQGFGAVVLGLGAVAALAGLPLPGWGLVLLVVALAAINLIFGFCAGCFVYFQIQRFR